MATAATGTKDRQLRRANPSTIHGKFLTTYHGWYTCPGDGGQPLYPGHHGWHKWFEQPLPERGHPRFDLYPEIALEEGFDVPGLTLPSGGPAKLFSSRNSTTVKRHFRLMAEHGVDGVLLIRMANECEVEGNSRSPLASLMRVADGTIDLVRASAEAESRAWALMYDITGVSPHKLGHTLQVDWGHMVIHKRILESTYYLRENGRPVIAFKGVGLKGTGQDLAAWFQIVQQMKSFTPGGAYIVFCGSAHWRTPGQGDQEHNPGFTSLYKVVDAICPWSVGLAQSEEQVEEYASIVRDDLKLVKQWNEEAGPGKRVDYIPVAYPGMSCHNLSGKPFNEVPRQSGKFFWRQIYQYQREGAHSIICASFDDFNQGTAVLNATTLSRLLPNEWRFLALDADGDSALPSDWYLRICGMAGEAMRGEKRLATDLMPRKELDDYWAMRPKYEAEDRYDSGQSQGAGPSSSYVDTRDAGASSTLVVPRPPMRSETVDLDNMPPAPPPYSLEDDNAGMIVPDEAAGASASPVPQPASSTGFGQATAAASTVPQGSSFIPAVQSNNRPNTSPQAPAAPAFEPLSAIENLSLGEPAQPQPSLATRPTPTLQTQTQRPSSPTGPPYLQQQEATARPTETNPMTFPVFSLPGQSAPSAPPQTSPSASPRPESTHQTPNRVDSQDATDAVGGFASPSLVRQQSHRLGPAGTHQSTLPPPPQHPARIGTSPRPNLPQNSGLYQSDGSGNQPYRPQSPPRRHDGPSFSGFPSASLPSSSAYGQPRPTQQPTTYPTTSSYGPTSPTRTNSEEISMYPNLPQPGSQNPYYSQPAPSISSYGAYPPFPGQYPSSSTPPQMPGPLPPPRPQYGSSPSGSYDQWNNQQQSRPPPGPYGGGPSWPNANVGGPAGGLPYPAPYGPTGPPPRPPASSSYSPSFNSGSGMPLPDTVLGPARAAIDMVAGQERRKQLEQGMGRFFGRK